MKKGFTLVEVLAVITILGVLAVIVVPAVDRGIKNAKDDAYNKQKVSLLNSLEAWTKDNYDRFYSNDEIVITLAELKQANIVDSDIRNPKTESCLSNAMRFVIKKTKNTYSYKISGDKLLDGSEDDCSSAINNLYLELLGDNPVTWNPDTGYVEPGVKFKDFNSVEHIITSENVNLTFNVPTYAYQDDKTKLLVEYIVEGGKSYIQYTLTTNGLVYSKTRNVNVIDTTPPVLEIGTPITTSFRTVLPFSKNYDYETGIRETICEYGKDLTYGNVGMVDNNSCRFVSNGENMYYRVTSVNYKGLSTIVTGLTETISKYNLTITTEKNITNSDDVVIGREYKIESNVLPSFLSFQYRIISKYDSNSSTDWDRPDTKSTDDDETAEIGYATVKTHSSIETPTYIYARIYNNITREVIDETVFVEVNLDLIAPKINATQIIPMGTNTYAIPFTVEDKESAITEVGCRYYAEGESEQYGVVQDNICIITTTLKEFYSYIQAENSNGLVGKSTPIYQITPQEISITPDSTGWAYERDLTVRGAKKGYTLQYKRGSGYSWTDIKSGGTVYVTTTSTPTSPTTVYVRLYNKKTYSTDSTLTYTETQVDRSFPALTLGSITETDSTITVPFTVSDYESGLKSISCTYNSNNGSTWTYAYSQPSVEVGKNYLTGSCVYTKSQIGRGNKYFRVVAFNVASPTLYQNNTNARQTSYFVGESLKVTSSKTGWAKTKTMTLKGVAENSELQYKLVVSSDHSKDVDWTTKARGSIITLNSAATLDSPTYIYLRFKNTVTNTYSDTYTYTETAIDPTDPIVTLSTGVATHTSITVPFTAEDPESDIASTVCKYGTSNVETSSNAYNRTGSLVDGACVISNISGNIYYKITSTNGAGYSTSRTSSAMVEAFKAITITPNGSNWATSREITITSEDASQLQYKIVVGSDTTQNVDWTNIVKGGKITLTHEANTAKPTTVYVRLNEGNEYSETATYIETKIGESASNVYYTPVGGSEITVEQAISDLYNRLGE